MNKNYDKTKEELLREVEGLRLKVVELELVKRQYDWSEERLRAEKGKAQLYLDMAGAIMLVLDTQGKVTLINKKGSEVLGYDQNEVIGKQWIDNFLPERNRDEARKVFFRIISGSKNSVRYEYYENPVLTKNQEERIIYWHNTPISDKEGRIVATLSSGEDITDQKNAEEARLQSLEFYRSLVKASPDAIVLFDLDLNIIMVNQRAADLFRFEQKEEAIGKNAFKFIAPEDKPQAEKELQQLKREGNLLAIEYNLIKEDGTTFQGEINAAVIRDAYGNIKALMAVVRDVTQRKQAEEAIREAMVRERTMVTLQESRDYFDKIINSVADPIFVKDREHRWVLLNDACCKFMGYEREELISKSDYDYFSKREANIFWNRDEVVFGAGKENINEEEFTNSKGVTHTISTKKTLYTDSQGNQFIVGIIRDITERKRIEDERIKWEKLETELRERKKAHIALEESEARYKLLADSAGDAMFVADVGTEKIIEANKIAEELLGLPRNRIIGMHQSQLHPKEDVEYYKALFKEHAHEGKGFTVDCFVTRGDGSKVPVEIRAVLTEKEGRKVLHGVFRDVAERKKAEENLRQRSERIIRHQKILLELAKLDYSDFTTALQKITEMDSKTLGAERISIWFFNEDCSAITCEDLYELSKDSHESGSKLMARDYPNYFKALEESRSISVYDARTDPRTCEFTENYLKVFWD